MPQIGGHGHALQPGFVALDFQRGFVQRDVERHCRAGLARVQRAGGDHAVGQHGDFVAGHVNGGQARVRHAVQHVAGRNGQRRRGNVDAQRDLPAAQSLDGERVVNFGGLRVVNGIRLHASQRQVICGRQRSGQRLRRKLRAFGKVLEQKALPVKLVGRGDGARVLQQLQRGQLRGARCFHHGLVFGRVFVGLEQDFVELRFDFRRTAPGRQLGRPGAHLRGNLLFLFDGRQRLRDDVGGGLAKAPFARAAKVVRRAMQRHQHGCLLHGAGRAAKVIGRQRGKAEFVFRREFPGQRQLHLRRHFARLRQQIGGRGFVKTQKLIGRLDFHPLARVQLHLRRCLGLRKNAARKKFARFVKQKIHGRGLSHRALPGCRRARPRSRARRRRLLRLRSGLFSLHPEFVQGLAANRFRSQSQLIFAPLFDA